MWRRRGGMGLTRRKRENAKNGRGAEKREIEAKKGAES